jgi:hypothetical protein
MTAKGMVGAPTCWHRERSPLWVLIVTKGQQVNAVTQYGKAKGTPYFTFTLGFVSLNKVF